MDLMHKVDNLSYIYIIDLKCPIIYGVMVVVIMLEWVS